MSRTALRTATLSFLVSQGATLNVYWDAINTGVHLFALQEFGSSGRGGRLAYELSIAPTPCLWRSATHTAAAQNPVCDWGILDNVYVTLLTNVQWINVTHRLADIDQLGQLDCMQPSAIRAQLSYEKWYDTHCMAGDAAALEASPEWLLFNATLPLPSRADRYVFALFNCRGEDLKFVGRMSFEDTDGEGLSLPQRSLLTIRLLMLGVVSGAAAMYALLALVQRAVTVPLQWLLVVVLLLHAGHQALMIPPLIAVADGSWVYRGSASTVVERFQSTEEGCRLYPSWEFPLHVPPSSQPLHVLRPQLGHAAAPRPDGRGSQTPRLTLLHVRPPRARGGAPLPRRVTAAARARGSGRSLTACPTPSS